MLIGETGLNNLDGFDVTNFEILLRPEADGTNMIGTVYIRNPSVLTIAMVRLFTAPGPIPNQSPETKGWPFFRGTSPSILTSKVTTSATPPFPI